MKKMIAALLLLALLLPVVSMAEVPAREDVRAGAVVTFGTFEQDGDESNGQEPIEWIVLLTDDTGALLLSRYLLDAGPLTAPKAYDKVKKEGRTVTWSNCELKAFLNGGFGVIAFVYEEQEAIMPYMIDDEENLVFLLSEDEVRDLLSGDNAIALPTAYALAEGANTAGSDKGAAWWWLRSPGDSDSSFALVMNDGTVYPYGDFCFYDGGIRPALWLNLNKLN